MNACESSPIFDAIILAGGRARRLGGHSKPDLEVAGWRMLELTCAAAAQAQDMVVVGPEGLRLPVGAHRTQESPAHGGPVAGILAGLRLLDSVHRTRAASPLAQLANPPAGYRITAPEYVLVLACDVPLIATAIPRLMDTLTAPATGQLPDGAHLVDEDGRPQWLAGFYRAASLTRRVAELDGGTGLVNVSVRHFVEGLHLRGVAARDEEAMDVDTWSDHEKLQLLARALH